MSHVSTWMGCALLVLIGVNALQQGLAVGAGRLSLRIGSGALACAVFASIALLIVAYQPKKPETTTTVTTTEYAYPSSAAPAPAVSDDAVAK